MEHIGKAVGTVAVWGGAIGLLYLFNSFGILNSEGAFALVIFAVVLTHVLWRDQ